MRRSNPRGRAPARAAGAVGVRAAVTARRGAGVVASRRAGDVFLRAVGFTRPRDVDVAPRRAVGFVVVLGVDFVELRAVDFVVGRDAPVSRRDEARTERSSAGNRGVRLTGGRPTVPRSGPTVRALTAWATRRSPLGPSLPWWPEAGR